MTGSRPDSDLGLTLRWRTIAIVAATLALTSTITLAVLITKRHVADVDVLSIVAFTVAILSFIFQLLIAGAQERSSREQVNNATTINAQTQSALAELRTLTGEMQRRRDDQFESVLSYVLPSAITDAVGDDPANEQLAELLTSRLTVALRTAMHEGGSDDGRPGHRRPHACKYGPRQRTGCTSAVSPSTAPCRELASTLTNSSRMRSSACSSTTKNSRGQCAPLPVSATRTEPG